MTAHLNDEYKTLQHLLRQMRREAHLSQHELAALLRKPQSFVSKYESGERRLDILELRQICRALKIDLAVFSQRLEEALVRAYASRPNISPTE